MTRRNAGSIVLFGVLSVALIATGCGDDSGGGGGTDATISLFDATPPDAAIPDAFVCVETADIKACGTGMAGCVDITKDNENCGGCGMACASSGRACVAGPDGDAGAGANDIAHCECPPVDFLPATPSFIDLSQFIDPVSAAGQDHLAIGVIQAGALAHVLAVTFNIMDGTATPIGADVDLAGVTGNAPRVAAGFNVDLQSAAAQTAYVATSGTLNLDYACATGLAGTVTDAVFAEVAGLMNPTPVDGGCGFSIPSITFSYGDDCGTVDMDAGVAPDAQP